MKHIDNLLYALGQMSVYGKEYLLDQKEMIKLEAADRGAKILSRIVSRLLIIIVSFFMVLFASLTLSFGLASYLDSLVLGFGIVAFLYLLFILLVIFLRKRLITNIIFRILFNDIMN